MSRVFVCGLGTVSPAGWGLPAMRAALDKGQALPMGALVRPGWDQPLRIRQVPNPSPRPACLGQPRLRRASPITQYAAVAAEEALGQLAPAPKPARLGLIMCLYCGCIQYSYRFFDEALKDPATASPLVFPETVFAAPASHLAALFEAPFVATLVGDPATFLQGMALATDWLLEGRVDFCLVVGAEETNWLQADAFWHFDHQPVLSGGAGAVCLGLDSGGSVGVELSRITAVHTYSSSQTRLKAAAEMRAQLPGTSGHRLLCDGVNNLSRLSRSDTPEIECWKDWDGPRLSLKMVLGEGLMAAAAWQCVAACDVLAQKLFPSALVSLVGCNQQAIGAEFARAGTGRN